MYGGEGRNFKDEEDTKPSVYLSFWKKNPSIQIRPIDRPLRSIESLDYERSHPLQPQRIHTQPASYSPLTFLPMSTYDRNV
jgi:hypothetical protein